jgi:hypothetical protein
MSDPFFAGLGAAGIFLVIYMGVLIMKGLKRIWIIGSVLCFLYPLIKGGKAYSFGIDVSTDISF